MANNTTTQTLADMLFPYFPAEFSFRRAAFEKNGAYRCGICGDDMGPAGDDVIRPISYNASKYGTWCHLACVTASGYALNTDAKVKFQIKRAASLDTAARQGVRAALASRNALVTAMTPAPAAPTPCEPTVSLDTFEAELRAKIEDEYDALLSQAIEKITTQNEQIRLLQLELAKVRSVAQVTDPLPAPTTTSTVGRCGSPKGDGLPCKWNVDRSPCPHHTRSADGGSLRYPTTSVNGVPTENARQNDSALTDDEKRAARAQKRADRSKRLGRVA